MQIIGAGQPEAGGSGDIVEGSDAGFEADVLTASMERPVIVDFWAPWCGPCRQLTPAIEDAVRAAKGGVKLVKINIDEHPAVAGQLRVQSIPAVYAFDKGRPVDGFMGALPASEVQAFVNRLAGGTGAEEAADLVKKGGEALAAGDVGGAAQFYAQALQIDPENAAAIAGMARCYLANGDPERARELIDAVPDDKKDDPDVKGVLAALELAADAPAPDELAALTSEVEGAPGDHAKRFELAQALAARGDLEAASGHLLEIVARDREWNEEAARKELLKIFEAAGAASPVARDGRRKLSALLFS